MNGFNSYAKIIAHRARQALEDNKAEQAHELARKAVKLDSGLIDAWLILAATSPPDESVKYLERVLALDPANPKGIKGLAWVEKKLTGRVSSNDLIFTETEKYNDSPYYDSIGPKTRLSPEYHFKDSGSRKKASWKNSFRWQSLLVLVCISLIVIVAIFAPLFAPLEKGQPSQYFKETCKGIRCLPEPPGDGRILGTIKGFDVFHTLTWGTRQALTFGLSAALFTAFIGTLLGAVAAFSGGFLDRIIMRTCDALLAFPVIAAVALFVQVIAQLTLTSYGLAVAQFDAILEKLNFFQSLLMNSDPVFLAFVLFSWMPYSRIMHAQVLRIKNSEYVNAARVLGAKKHRLIFRHVLPNSVAPCIVIAARDVGRMIVLQASFTFIGVGSSSSWSTLLIIGKNWIIGPGGNLITRWWIYLPITLAILFFGISWSMLGDEINHTLNPRNT